MRSADERTDEMTGVNIVSSFDTVFVVIESVSFKPGCGEEHTISSARYIYAMDVVYDVVWVVGERHSWSSEVLADILTVYVCPTSAVLRIDISRTFQLTSRELHEATTKRRTPTTSTI